MTRILLLIFAFMFSAPLARADDTVVIKGVKHFKGLKVGKKKLFGFTRVYPVATDLPDSYDARTDGSVTSIKDQGQCGSCWAFARTSSLEAASIKAGLHDSTVNLSEQDLVSNASDEYGCGGGSMDFNREIAHGVTTEALCPYRAQDGVRCLGAVDTKALKMAYIGGPNGPTADEMRGAIKAFGSVAVTTAAGNGYDTDSGSDRMTNCGTTGIDHMVSWIGWRKLPDGSFEFLEKNSWGTSWGKLGLAYLKIGCNETAVGDQSAMVVYVDGPGPIPVVNLQLPIEVITHAGVEVPIQVPDVPANIHLLWSTGETGPVIWVKPLATTIYTLTATDDKGNKTSATVNVVVN